jgi:hypothetical protein
MLERCIAYGQLLRILELSANLSESRHEPQERGLLLAVIRPCKLRFKNLANTPYYRDGKFEPIEVVDVDIISCLVACVPDHERGTRLWALCECQDAMDATNLQGEHRGALKDMMRHARNLNFLSHFYRFCDLFHIFENSLSDP